MPLLHAEVQPGLVAFLRSTDLTNSTIVQKHPDDDGRTFRDGPFLCVASDGQHCAWLSMTSRQNDGGHRFQLLRSAFFRAPYRMLTRPNFITDLRHPYIGPVDVFVAASRIDRSNTNERPRVGTRAMQDVIARMRYLHTFPEWLSPEARQRPACTADAY